VPAFGQVDNADDAESTLALWVRWVQKMSRVHDTDGTLLLGTGVGAGGSYKVDRCSWGRCNGQGDPCREVSWDECHAGSRITSLVPDWEALIPVHGCEDQEGGEETMLTLACILSVVN